MILKETIDKEKIKELPKVFFPGEIQLIDNEIEANKAVNYLSSQSLLGIDSETRPTFSKGQSHKVALLQISTDDCCFLFRLNRIGLLPSLTKLLESTSVVKIGLSLKDDFLMLHKRAIFKQQAYVELQDYVNEFGIKDKSLQKIYAILFNKKISKTQRLSNWEADTLSEAQQQYAAIDAWACLKIYKLLQELKQTNDYELEIEPKEIPIVEEIVPEKNNNLES